MVLASAKWIVVGSWVKSSHGPLISNMNASVKH